MPTIASSESQARERSERQEQCRRYLRHDAGHAGVITGQVRGKLGESWGTQTLFGEAAAMCLSRRKLAQCTPHERRLSCHESQMRSYANPNSVPGFFHLVQANACVGPGFSGERSTFGAVLYEHRRGWIRSRTGVSGINLGRYPICPDLYCAK